MKLLTAIQLASTAAAAFVLTPATTTAALILAEDFASATFNLDGGDDNSFTFSEFDDGDGWYTAGEFGGIRKWGTFADKGPLGVGDTSASLDFDNQFSGGLGYVVADGRASSGLYTFSFDYKVTAPGNFAVTVWGIEDPTNDGWDGGFQVTGGSGAFGPNQAAFGNRLGGGTEGLKLLERRTQSEIGGEQLVANGTWNSYSTLINLGTGYDYLILGFGANDATASNTNQADLVGLDNVRFAPVPEHSTVLLACGALAAILSGKKRRQSHL